MRLVLAALLSLALQTRAASLLAIDYGTDSFKASLVKQGVPFDILINSDSKRSTPSIVVLRGEERSFGGAAANLATRFPKDTFSAVKLLLGGSTSSSQAVLHQSLYPSTSPPSTTSLSSSTTSYSPEEILAMQFSYAKEMAETLAGEAVREVVVTVPSWFGQAEREKIQDAVELAGLRSVGLVNDGTAAAINYAMTRLFPSTPSYHLFYDLGASSLRTTLVSLRSSLLPDPLSLSAKPILQNVTELTVHGLAYDLEAGGYYFDQILRDILQADFKKNGGKGLDERGMAKLLKEARRVKHVLSANVASVARIEGLVGDSDFKTVVTREQLEFGATNMVSKFIEPIYQALTSANLTLDDIESVIMIGGSSRVPMVEAAVRALVGESKIAKNVNADEAAVMGAALYGAGITRGFRTKDIRVTDATPFGIEMSYESNEVNEDGAVIIKEKLFPAFSKLGVKKQLNFNKTDDFSLRFSYTKNGIHSSDLFETTITGIKSAFTNLTDEVIANSSITVTMKLDESNIVSITKATLKLPAIEQESLPTMNDRLKGFLGKFSGDKNKTTPTEPTESSKAGKAEKEETAEEQAASLAEMEELLNSITPAKNSTITLKLDTVILDRVALSKDEKAAARKRLRDIKTFETRKLAREEARNVLEAYIYKARDLISSPIFMDVSTPDERQNIEVMTKSTGEWLEEADDASTKELKDKKSDLESLIQQVSIRAVEATKRPQIISEFHSTISLSSDFLRGAIANETIASSNKLLPRFTPRELEKLQNLIENASTWFEAKLVEQNNLEKFDDVVLKSVEAEKRAQEIANEVMRLSRKKIPKRPKERKTKKVEKMIEPEKDAQPEKVSEEPKEKVREKDEL